MKILTVGGGSGGHVTPVRAVINELSRLDPHLRVMFVCDASFLHQAKGIMEHAVVPVDIRKISAGKLRRYHGVSKLQQMLDIPTVAKNIRDIFKIGIGIVQSLVLLKRFRPEVVFAKGGFVCLPVGIAAKLCNIPIVIHDSDTRPGLTNRFLARWATSIGTGSPLENYPYDSAISHYVGVPIEPAFRPYSDDEKVSAKHEIGVVDVSKQLVVITGGGLGARSINVAALSVADELIESGFEVFHITGKANYESLRPQIPQHAGYHCVPFVFKDMDKVLGAADIVVSRASATFIQELAALKKTTIIVPAKHLGDQVKNAEVYRKAEAVLVLTDDQLQSNPAILLESILGLQHDAKAANAMARRLHSFARPDAALDMAHLIVDATVAKKEQQDV